MDNLEGFHNHSLFEPFSKVKMRKWTDLIYGEDLPKEAKELYLVHNCYTTGVFIVRGEITINESNPLKFKYQKICPPVEIRKDMKLQVNHNAYIIVRLQPLMSIIQLYLKLRTRMGL